MSDLRLYYKNDDFVFEIWGGSTKHPDSTFTFSAWKNREIIPDLRDNYDFDYAWLQWLSYIASTMLFESTTRDILQLAGEMYMDTITFMISATDLIKYNTNDAGYYSGTHDDYLASKVPFVH